MINIKDTYNEISLLFDNGCFRIEKWRKYSDKISEGLGEIFEDEIKDYIKTGEYSFEKDFLPMINSVYNNPKLESLHGVFLSAVENLDGIIAEKFGKEMEADIVFWLGLGTSAGCAGMINGRNTVLLGAEKILELGWGNKSDMYALVYHELGHIFHSSYGKTDCVFKNSEEEFIWQLFSEGAAMYFEQELCGDPKFFHQDKSGWKKFCDDNFIKILWDFNCELPSMSQFKQRYFGDWCDYNR